MRNPEPSTTQGQHRTQKYLVCFCPECWRFQDFRHNQDDVRDWTFMMETISRVEKIGQSHYSKGLKDPVTGLDMQKVVDYYLKYNMAPDPDTFQSELVKTVPTEQLKVLQVWFNEILAKGEPLSKVTE